MPFYIKYEPGDVPTTASGGHVERPVPAGAVTWLCSSIWLTDPQGFTIPGGKATVGKPCQIRVRVDANAIDPPTPSKDIVVQAWVCDYTKGGAGPGAVRAGGSIPISGLRDPDGPLDDVPNEPAVLAVIPWKPQVGDMWNLNAANDEAHMCIGVNAFFNVEEPVEGEELGLPASAGGLLDVSGNEHHAQRNISILKAAPETASADIEIAMHNPGDEEATFVIEAHAVDGGPRPVELEQLLALPFIERVDGDPFDPEKALAGGLLGAPLERLALELGGELALASDGTKLHQPDDGLEMLGFQVGEKTGKSFEVSIPPTDPYERPPFVGLQLQLADPEDFGAVQAVDVVQRAKDDQTVVGGCSVLLVNARPEDLELERD